MNKCVQTTPQHAHTERTLIILMSTCQVPNSKGHFSSQWK